MSNIAASPAVPAHRLRAAPPDRPGYEPLVIVLAGFAFGIAADRYFEWSVYFWWPAAALLLAVWCLLWRGEYRAGFIALGLSLSATGAAWHHMRWQLFAADEVARFAREQAQPVAIEAVALSAPRRVPAPPHNPMRAIPVGDRSRVPIAVTAIRDGTQWRAASGQALLLVDGHLLGVHTRDRLRVFAQLAVPTPAHNPGEFDFAVYSRGNRQLSVLRTDGPDSVTVVAQGGWSFDGALETLRRAGDRLLWNNLAVERLPLAEAVLLGYRESLDPEQNEAFLTTGTIHMLSISGLHVGILAMGLFWALRSGLVPRRLALAIVPLVIWLYTLVAGAEPPAVRAAIMVSVTCLAMYVGRGAWNFNTLAAAALVVLALNPVELFRVGTQLSFLSVACLIWIGPRWHAWQSMDPLDRLIAASRPWPWRVGASVWRWAWHMTLIGLLIWAVTLPLVAANFHLVSPVGILLNLLLAVPMTIAMVCGFGVLLLGWLFAPLGAVLGWICAAALMLLERVVTAGANLPWGHFWVAGPASWWVAGFYVGIVALVVLGARVVPMRWSVALAAGWIGLAFAAPLARSQSPDRLECDFVSVGHGGAELLRLPGGRTILYDAGALGSPAAAARSISAYLWACGVTHLDAVVISHADTDHYNALPDLLERFSVGAVYVSPVMFRTETAALTALREGIKAAGVPLREISTADVLQTGSDCHISVLHPPPDGVPGSDNANSVVLSIDFRGRRVLLTGDLAPPGLNRVLMTRPLKCDVLLVPHHGSLSSRPQDLATWSSPGWAVISGGYLDGVEEIRDAYAKAGARVLHTALAGAVSVVIDGNRMAVASWRLGPQGR